MQGEGYRHSKGRTCTDVKRMQIGKRQKKQKKKANARPRDI